MEGKRPKIWLALEITAEPAAADAVEHALNELNALGTEIDLMRHGSDVAVTIVGYFDELPDDEILKDGLHHALRIYELDESSIRFVERREVADQDWLHEWKKHWKPTKIGRFIIAPPWDDVNEDRKIVVRIEPNMAFGTGTHETTRLCLKAIDENFLPGQSFLDVGTGTGILAIAVAKISNVETAKNAEIEKKKDSSALPYANSAIPALRILAYDTHADSIRIASENAELNEVASAIDFQVGAISSETPVLDFVCANLTVEVILPILDLLLNKAAKILILSGILVEQEEMIVSALLTTGVKDFSIERAGEWIGVTIAK
jgi:ribosomal protein L11 methyltransferase